MFAKIKKSTSIKFFIFQKTEIRKKTPHASLLHEIYTHTASPKAGHIFHIISICLHQGRIQRGRGGKFAPPLRFRGKKGSQFDKSRVFFNFKPFGYFLFNVNVIINIYWKIESSEGRKQYFSSLLKINITNYVSIRRHCVLFYWCY